MSCGATDLARQLEVFDVTPNDDCPTSLVRYSVRESINKLSERFSLPAHPYMQDWEVEVSDPRRVIEFVDAYSDDDLDDDNRFALMALIVASLDEALLEHLDITDPWSRVEELLRRNARLHASTMSYWSCADDPDPEHQFQLTPFVRRVWREVRSSL